MIHLTAATTPTPKPVTPFDETLVTPGVIGFAVTVGIAIAVILLLIDLNRRVRRLQFRAEAQRVVRAELAARAENGDDDAPATTESEGPSDPPSGSASARDDE